MTGGPEGWLAALRRAGAGQDPRSVLATVARHVACTASTAVAAKVDGQWPGGADLPAAALPDADGSVPDALGWAYEALADAGQRRRGLHYTPQSIAERLVAVALDDRGEVSLCDPACGGGAFLLAAARHLAASGIDRRTVVDRCLVGLDLDPVAVDVATTTLTIWCGDADVEPRVAVADALSAGVWPHRPVDGFDVVVGNPPFQSQLGAATVRATAEVARLRATFGDAVGAYVDTAALFLLAAVAQTRPGGRILLIQPQSVLATRDAAPLRRRLDEIAPLEGLWVCDEPVFAAATRVCAPILRVELAPDSVARVVRRWQGPEVVETTPADRPEPGCWAELAADLRGIPPVVLGGPVLEEAASASAGFRDEYYGLVPFVGEATGGAGERPLVTSGLVDPAECAWGRREVRFAKQRWQRPVLDVDGLTTANPSLGRWVQERLVPKVVVATQTRVLEVAVDVDGTWVASTPVISVPVAPERLWHVAAALSAPPVTAWALRLSAGTALVPDALKLSAAQVRSVPAPIDPKAWDDGADQMRAAQKSEDPDRRREALRAMGSAMVAAYAVDDAEAMLEWWFARLRGRSDIAKGDR